MKSPSVRHVSFRLCRWKTWLYWQLFVLLVTNSSGTLHEICFPYLKVGKPEGERSH